MRTHPRIPPALVAAFLLFALSLLVPACGPTLPEARVAILSCARLPASPTVARIAYRVTVEGALPLSRFCAVFRLDTEAGTYWRTELVEEFLPPGAQVTGECDLELGTATEAILGSTVESTWFE